MPAQSLSCRELIDFLFAYLEGELLHEQRSVFEAHLSICPYCVDYVQSYRETIRLGHAAHFESEIAEPPEELVHAILVARSLI